MQKGFIHKLLEFAVKRSVVIIALVILISLFFGYYAVEHSEVNANVSGLVSEQDTIGKNIEQFTHEGQGATHLVINVSGENLYDLESLQLLESVTKKMEGLDNSLPSINPFNLITFEKDGRRLEVQTMAPEGRAPRNAEELEIFRERLFNDPFARNLVVSEDGDALSVIIPITRKREAHNYVENATEILAELEDTFDVHVTGDVFFADSVERYLLRDLTFLLILAVVVILVIYYLSFRAIRSAVLTLMVVALGTLWSVGFMALAGFTISMVSITTPVLVLTLGSSYSIHVLNQYFRESLEHLGSSPACSPDCNLWIADSVSHVGRTILMACLTTIIGFLSLLATSIQQTREFGIATSVGIISCALLSFFFLPAMLRYMRPPSQKQQKRVREGVIVKTIENLGTFVLKRRIYIIIFFVVVIGVFAVFHNRLKYETNVINYFPKKEKIVTDTQYIYKKMKGYDQFTVSLVAPDDSPNYFMDADVLRQVSEFEKRLMADPDITGILSFVSYLEHLNEVMYGEKKIPESRPLTLLLSRYIRTLSEDPNFSNMIGTMANEDFTRLDLTVWCYDHTYESMSRDTSLSRMLNNLEEAGNQTLPEEVTFAPWGVLLRIVSVADLIGRDQLISTALSLILVFIATTIAFKSFRYGFFSLIPIVMGIFLNFIFMIIFKIPMDVTTVMFSIVVVGVGVDNSIHFILRFRDQARKHGEDIATILDQTLKIAGRPIIVSTMSIIGGLLVFTFASFRPISYFGVLVAFALLTAAVSTLVILPAILTLGWKKQKRLRK